jgi:SAM-dependent methyltransferase
MQKKEKDFTRGKGLLEGFLAGMRAKKANQLIPNELRTGRILDIGCGAYPYFLSHTFFHEKVAIDQQDGVSCPTDIDWHILDLNIAPHLSFPDESFQVVTMLAVVEHLDPGKLSLLVKEIYRVLVPGGVFIMTTPASWADGLLKALALLGLVSKEEIDEHTFAYTLPLLGWYMGKAGFDLMKVKFGIFELGLNLWARAEK